MNIVKDRFKPIDKGKMYTYLVGLCWFTIILCWVLKLFGYKEFQMPEYTYNIPLIVRQIINFIFYCINGVAFSILLTQRKLKFKEVLIICGLCLIPYVVSLFQISKVTIIKFVLELIVYIVIGILFVKEKILKIIIEVVLILLLFSIFQLLCLMFKNIKVITNNNFITMLFLQIDYYILMFVTALAVLNKGGENNERRQSILVILSKQISFRKSISKNQSVIHKESVESEKGYKLFVVMLSVFQFVLVGTLCYFINNVTCQYVVVFVSFVFMRLCFGKSYHCNSVIACTTLSCVTFISATRLGLPPHISVLCNVLNGCLLAYLMYVFYYFNKYTTAQAITIRKGMSKESLLEVCNVNNLTDLETNILIDYYVNRHKLIRIANKYGYSEDRLKAIKREVLERISK